ncbi:hypothetical protein AMK59_1580 [Oryctes borbonicus]|uniref:SET domain-containing protein n=1 Tax=Oryctes borbonicus TaxID=1629725 RepID=A0A0T6BB86_9SCAR|nr:hypothetical protein AMK59_1580 [Oryctes borbonicus]
MYLGNQSSASFRPTIKEMEDLKNFDVQSNRWKLGGSNLKLECVACCAEDSVEVSANIKQEVCVEVNHDVNLGNFVNVKPDTEDRTVQNLVFYNELKEELNTLCCEVCGDDYDLYCTKCSMLVRIFDANVPNKIKNTIKQTLPKNFFDIREIYPGDIGVITLKTIPHGVTFGPFEGLVPIIVENTSKWKINMGKLDYLRDPRCLNWMQYIRYSEDLLCRNLMPFQYDNQLFYQSTRLIEEGEELLVWFENGNTKDNNYIQLSVIKKELEDVYACIFCCLGFNSATFLLKHNTVCPGKKDKNLFFKG